MALAVPERLEIRLQNPNPLFEKWLERWLKEAENRNFKSQHKLREALEALRSYPLPLGSGRECAILRGFGTKLCNLIDEELHQLQQHQPQIYNIQNTTIATYQSEVQKVAKSVQKIEQAAKKQKKITKKAQKAIDDEEERQRQVTMSAGSFRIILFVDTQETKGKNKRTNDQTLNYLDALNVEYEVRHLSVGDFLWIARDEQGNELVLPYIVERKRMDDLASSIRDGRYREQKHRLLNCGVQNVIYLVEDYGSNENLGLPLETLEQAIINTKVHYDFCTVRTENHYRSMQYLQIVTQTLIQLFKDKILISSAKEDLIKFKPTDQMVGLLKFRALNEDSAKNAKITVREVFIMQLMTLHSLTLEKALAIVERYPTPRLLFDGYDACQTEEEARLLLANIPFGENQRTIGRNISEILYELYRTFF